MATSPFAAVSLPDRIPPHNMEAEMASLGAMLLGDRGTDSILTILNEDDFYSPGHKEIFRACHAIAGSGKAVDLVTLRNELSQREVLDEVGGLDYLIQLAESVPSASNAPYYAGIVLDLATLRRLESAGHDIVALVHDRDKDADEKVDEAESLVFEVGRKRLGRQFESVKSLAKEFFSDVDHLIETGEPILGLPSGFKDLDDMTTGLYGGDFVILAARPSMGKTSLAMNMAMNVSRAKKGAVAVFSLEMSAKQLVRRMVSTISGVPTQALKKSNLANRDYQRLADACEELYSLPLMIDDTSDISALEMRGKCRRLKADHGLAMVVVDYLQLMRGSRKSENRTQEVSDIARALKSLAKELDVPVMALSQLNRGVESRPDKRPQLSDIRESGSIEAEADLVMFIYRDAYYRAKEEDAGPQNADEAEVAEIIVGKHRNGPTGVRLLGFQRAYTRFTLLDAESKEEYFRKLRSKSSDD
ncbi:MAG: replicative DNA helicase [Fimbriimonadaceae bacterium]